MTRIVLLCTLLFAGCTDEDNVNIASFAIDTDSSGAVDCADLDHVVACIEHPDPHACAHADVNGDGAVDDADAHTIHDALVATHHECAEPEHHH